MRKIMPAMLPRRRRHLGLTLPAASGVACVVCAACFSQSSGGGPPGATFDAAMADDFSTSDSTTPPEDSSQPEAAASDVTSPPEAGPDTSVHVDASTDGAVADAGTPVTVTVIGGAGYEAGVLVIFEDASGTVLGTPTTGASGTASLVVPAGSLVTVVIGPASAPVLYTVLGLQPGQQVPVQDWSSFVAPTLEVTAIPSSPVFDAGVFQYAWTVGGNPQFGLTVPSPTAPWSASPGAPTGYDIGVFGATVGAVSSVVAQAENSPGGVLGFAVARDVALASSDGGAINLDLGTTWSTATTSQTVGATAPDAGAFTGGNGTYLSEVADGIVMPLTLTNTPITHVGFADFTQAEVEFLDSNWGIAVSLTLPPTASGSVTVDATGLAAAPAFTNASVNMVGMQPTLTWTLSQGSLATITGLVAITPFTLITSDGGQVNGTWTLVSPGTAQATIAVPPIPPLEAMAGGFATPTVYAVTGQTAVTSYGDLLKMGTHFPPISGCVNGPFVPALPSVGTALVSIYSSGLGC